MKQIIRTDHAPGSALFSQGLRVGSTVYVSGMTGVDVTSATLAGPTIQEQTLQSLRNCEAVLAAAGGSLADVVQVTVLLSDPKDFAGMNEAYARVFADELPTRAVTKLGVELPGVLISISMIAELEQG
jgi:2-iminobutanoate/2-iminopropanoate deaminase